MTAGVKRAAARMVMHRRSLPAALRAGPLMAGCARTGPEEQPGTGAGAVTGAALGHELGKGL